MYYRVCARRDVIFRILENQVQGYMNEDGEKGVLTASSVNILIADFLYIWTLCGQFFQ